MPSGAIGPAARGVVSDHPGSAFYARDPRTGQDASTASTLLYIDEITNLFDNLIRIVEGRLRQPGVGEMPLDFRTPFGAATRSANTTVTVLP